jgi:hypothetical protein
MHARGVAIAVICAVTLVVGAASAQAFKLVGTKAGNLLVGSKGPDRLVGKGGGDLIKGRGGNDVLSGGKARDLVNGGPGADRLIAGPGNDGIKAADGKADRLIDGGRGNNVCVIDIPADLSATRNCGTIRIPSASGGGAGGGGSGGGAGGGGGGGGGTLDPTMLEVNSASGLTCLPILGCAFTITGEGADALVGTVTAGGAITLLAGTAMNDVVLGTWLATGSYKCAPGAAGWLVVTMGEKSTPQIPVQC